MRRWHGDSFSEVLPPQCRCPANRGMLIHRIWSTAWFYDRASEETRLREAIAVALAGEPPPLAAAAPVRVDVVVEDFDFGDYPEWVYTYEPPREPASPGGGLDFTEPSARSTIVRQIVEVVSESGPVHEDVVLDVIRTSWGIGRAGSRIREASMPVSVVRSRVVPSKLVAPFWTFPAKKSSFEFQKARQSPRVASLIYRQRSSTSPSSSC